MKQYECDHLFYSLFLYKIARFCTHKYTFDWDTATKKKNNFIKRYRFWTTFTKNRLAKTHLNGTSIRRKPFLVNARFDVIAHTHTYASQKNASGYRALRNSGLLGPGHEFTSCRWHSENFLLLSTLNFVVILFLGAFLGSYIAR